MHLIRFPFFKNVLKLSTYSSQNNIRTGYLLNNQIYNKFKQIYQLKKLFDVLEDNNLLNEITYQNCDDNYFKINDFLNIHKIDYINHIQKYEIPGGTKFQGSEIILTPKYINNKPTLKYIDNFEIIDQEFYSFLIQKYGENLFMYKVYYSNIEDKIFLIIDYEQTYIYEIVNINPEGGDFIVEYIIEVKIQNIYNSSFYNKNSLNNLIFKTLFNFGIHKFISIENPIIVTDNVSLKLHPINCIIKQSIKSKKTNQKYNFESNIILNAKTSFIPASKNMKIKNDLINYSDRLKVMILLAISQKYEPESKIEKVHLINPKWLDEYKFKEINSLIDSRLNEIINLWNNNYDLNSVIPIITILDKNKLQQYNSLISFNTQINSQSSPDQLALSNKYIDLYKNFILVNNKMFNLLSQYFRLSSTNDDISYIHSKRQGDFIIFKNYQSYNSQNQNELQNIILVGIIDKKLNEFKIQHIFDFNDKNILEKELQIILKYSIPNYIYNETCLSPQNKNEVFSPIFHNDKIIGNYYQYIDNYNYRNITIYLNYLDNEKIKKVIYLLINELSIKNKLNNINYYEGEFYLVNKKLLKHIKNTNNYNLLKNYFIDKINIPPGQKEIYSIIKKLPKDILENLNQTYITKDSRECYEIEIYPIYNPFYNNESYMIIKYFELIEKNIAQTLLVGQYPFHILKCSFVGNKTIVFHYPKNSFNNQKNILVVSKINEDNNFLNEYLLIYKKDDYYTTHFEQIKYKLNNFLQSLVFLNNAAPIIMKDYIEIGIVIKLVESAKFERINEPAGISKKIIAVNFRSIDQSINYPVGGLKTDKFLILEEKLYKEFPQLRNKNAYFIANGIVINRELTLEQNKINSGNTILIQFY